MSKNLSARERQIMEVVHRLGTASARDIQSGISDAPSYSAIRTLIRILEEKGALSHREESGRYLYTATVPREKAGLSALRGLMSTFFDDSPERAFSTLLSSEEVPLDDAELDRLSALIERARSERREKKGDTP